MTLRASTEDLRLEIDENPEGIISGEWEGNFSILTYSDLKAYLESQTMPDHKVGFELLFFLILMGSGDFDAFFGGILMKITPTAVLGEVMSSPIRTATVDQSLEEIEHHFEFVSGLPVVDGDVRCVGVVSRKDFSRASHGVSLSLIYFSIYLMIFFNFVFILL